MKNLFILGIIGAIVYFVFFNSPFKKDFYFNGEEYKHTKVLSGGEITNYFYTINGEKSKYAQTFIQLLEISDKIPKRDWPKRLKPILNRYHLKPFKNRDSEYTGTVNLTGLYLNAFAVPIKVKEAEHMILFITSTGDVENKPSVSKKKEILDEMKSLEAVFN